MFDCVYPTRTAVSILGTRCTELTQNMLQRFKKLMLSVVFVTNLKRNSCPVIYLDAIQAITAGVPHSTHTFCYMVPIFLRKGKNRTDVKQLQSSLGWHKNGNITEGIATCTCTFCNVNSINPGNLISKNHLQ